MESFYDDAWKVRGLKLKRKNSIVSNVGCDNSIGSNIKDAGNVAVRAEFSTEQQDKDLKQSDIIDGFVETFNINKVRVKYDSEDIHTMSHNGKYSIRYPSKLDIQQQSKEIYNILLSITDGIARESDNDQSDLNLFLN